MCASQTIDLIARFQPLIAALIALLAALIGSTVAWRASTHKARVDKQSAAAALWAEIAAIGTRLTADMRSLGYESRHPGPRRYKPQKLDVAVFAADPSAVGRLPPEEAFMVINFYKLILELNDEYESYTRPGASDEFVGTAELADRVAPIATQAGVVLRGLYETAGLPVDKANAALKPWTTIIEK